MKNIQEIIKFNYKLKLQYFNIKYKIENYSIEECIINNKTHSINTYIPMELYHKQKTIIKKHLIKFGKIPLMTNQANFIVNGNKRVVVEINITKNN